MEKLLRIFSYTFHPLFVSVYAALLYFSCSDKLFGQAEIYVVSLQLIIITILIPMTFYYLLLTLGKVDSVMLAVTSQRRIPLLVHALLLLILLKRTITIEDYPELHFFFLGSLVSTLTAFCLALLNIKASLHMIGISALTIFIIGISLHDQQRMIGLIAALLVCNGLTATSRLIMKAHSPLELVLGAGVGVLPQLALLYFWL